MTSEQVQERYKAQARDADKKAAKASDAQLKDGWAAIAESYRALASTNWFLI